MGMGQTAGMTWLVKLELSGDNALLSLRFSSIMTAKEVTEMLQRAMSDTKNAGHAYTCNNVVNMLRTDLRYSGAIVKFIDVDLTVTG